MSVFSRTSGFLMRHPLLTWFVFVPLLAIVVLGISILITGIPTAQEIRADEAAAQAQLEANQREAQARTEDEAQRQAAAAANREQDKYFCRLETVCEKYGRIRQECATAGSFDNCIKVKMGDDDAGLTNSCTNDGNVLYPAAQMPNSLRCWGLRNFP